MMLKLFLNQNVSVPVEQTALQKCACCSMLIEQPGALSDCRPSRVCLIKTAGGMLPLTANAAKRLAYRLLSVVHG